MSIKDEWIADRAKALAEGPTTGLVACAEDAGVQIEDQELKYSLAKRVARAEWGQSRPHLHLDKDGVVIAFHGDEFNAMESGPQEEAPMKSEEDRPVKAMNRQQLQREIMSRWIGAIGGMDWYNGPTPSADRAQNYGKALAAVLDDVLGAEVAPPVGPQPQTSSGWFIYEVLLPEFLERFLAKNADYGDQHRTGLGVKAEYVGIHRKIEKLKSALWDEQAMNGEGAREMLFDLIGQCFIVLDLMAQEEAKRERGL